MTATSAPPSGATQPASDDRRAPDGVDRNPTEPGTDVARGGHAVDRPPHLLLAEVALALLTSASIYGFARIFDSFDFLAPLLAVAVVVHLVAAALRRRGVGIALSFVGLLITWSLLVTWLFFRETTFALLPTTDTLDAARLEMDRAWSAFSELVAPAPALTGFVVAAAIAVGVGAFLADWAAFRLWSSRDAVVPSLTLFVFATLLADERQRLASAVVYVAAALLFVLAHRVARLERSTGWVTSDRSPGGRALLGVGMVLLAVAVVAGGFVGPRLPGAESEAIVDWRGLQEDSDRVTVSPLVDIRSRLVQRSDAEVFQVRSTAPAYWRMTALDDFDGVIWRSSGSYERADGRLPAPDPESRDAESVLQEFRIQDLSTIWLPAAYVPTEVVADVPVAFQPDTATLIVDPDLSDADGATYVVESVVPAWSAGELEGAGTDVPSSVESQLELPSDFPSLASETARRVVDDAGADTPYEQALALQDFFRVGGGFVYDLEVESGHGDDAIVWFLENRRGYCEQFAGTFAAMARSLGIPARVAVGFTWGEEVATDADGLTTYQVRGRNAHAWPEVHLGDRGWVPFEPTPGRGAPSAEEYTGQAAAQAESSDAASDPTGGLAGAEDTSPTTEAPTDAAPTDQAEGAAGGGLSATADATDGGGGGGSLLAAGAILALAVLGYLAAVPGRRAVLQGRRRAEAEGDPSARIRLGWGEVVDDLDLARLTSPPGETHLETARRVGAVLPEQAVAIERLALAADLATYAEHRAGPEQADQAHADATRIRSSLVSRIPRWRRWAAALDPRRAAGQTTPRHRVDRSHG